MKVKGDLEAKSASKKRRAQTVERLEKSEERKQALAEAHGQLAAAKSAPVPQELTGEQVEAGIKQINKRFECRYSKADVLAHRVHAEGAANIVFDDACKYPVFIDNIKTKQQEPANHPALMQKIMLQNAINTEVQGSANPAQAPGSAQA